MGQALSFGLTQYDVEELKDYCDGRFTQSEIEGLYRRFRALDRGRKGFISSEEFSSIPELSINPLHSRMGQMFNHVNFKEFALALKASSKRASREDKLRVIFSLFDVDNDGILSPADLELMIRQLAGSSLSEEDVKLVMEMALKEANASDAGLTFEDVAKALEGSELRMEVEMPVDY
ncbi:EF-hand [Coccomyxa subellipsoidea C-169]|uniref:EF-hand n=1 Tax=Coccomyxa subellipsoidea (strain C-169) TaxID=574566 RepID=I0YZZ9_COCSC|nr:EF-hand [Coccomyxa subellipsoidea C-169]EIE23968.1 EF-hand [Coccomyxa subellipsoidea C-169]|eukprot:XP_005648512.1 EF-hand [Coccomyxa subellipsoidea C-169]